MEKTPAKQSTPKVLREQSQRLGTENTLQHQDIVFKNKRKLDLETATIAGKV
jgi:hypothetical protein